MNTTAPSSRPPVLLVSPYPDWDMEKLKAAYEVHSWWLAKDREALLNDCADKIRAVATNGEKGISGDMIKRLPNLEIISCYGVGVDAIDLETAKSRGVRVTNTPDVLTGDVADLGMALALAITRRIPEGDHHVREGHWPSGPMPLSTRFYGKKLGVCGFGRIGKTVAKRATGFDMEIGYFDIQAAPDHPARFFASLEEMARWCDIMIVTLAGGAGTRNLVNKAVLEALGPNGFLVNVSRGTTVDETALLEALENKAIAGAGLDVFWNEPNIDQSFMALPNVVLQPHNASGTMETRIAMGNLVLDNLAAHFAGKPLLTPVV